MTDEKKPKGTPIFSKKDVCEKCGSRIIHLSFDRVGALSMELVECEKGHRYSRFRLIDVGE